MSRKAEAAASLSRAEEEVGDPPLRAPAPLDVIPPPRLSTRVDDVPVDDDAGGDVREGDPYANDDGEMTSLMVVSILSAGPGPSSNRVALS